jgi:hypothetical protein
MKIMRNKINKNKEYRSHMNTARNNLKRTIPPIYQLKIEVNRISEILRNLDEYIIIK